MSFVRSGNDQDLKLVFEFTECFGPFPGVVRTIRQTSLPNPYDKSVDSLLFCARIRCVVHRLEHTRITRADLPVALSYSTLRLKNLLHTLLHTPSMHICHTE